MTTVAIFLAIRAKIRETFRELEGKVSEYEALRAKYREQRALIEGRLAGDGAGEVGEVRAVGTIDSHIDRL